MATEQPPVDLAQRLQAAWLERGRLARSLLPLAWLFGAVSGLRRRAYRLGVWRAAVLPVPVVVVGNLVAGGAGKTPTVIALVGALRRRGHRPGVISRGHGGTNRGEAEVTPASSAAASGDEPLLMRLRTGAPVVVGHDRVAAARLLLKLHPGVDVIVSDDGLQHLPLPRTAQVLVFDERGAGNGWLLPAGPLREALPLRVPARTVVLYNAATPTTPLPGTLARRRLAGAVSLAGWWRGEPATGEVLEALRGRPLLAAAGLARPERFFEMLRKHGLSPQTLALPDHHDFATLPWPPNTTDVIVTEKDAIKLADASRLGATQVWVAPLDFSLHAAFEAALFALLPPPGTRHGNSPAEPARLSDLQGPA